LFNYSIKENVLYGKQFASNQEIKSACDIANASQFIEANEIEELFEDTPEALLNLLKNK
jgi:ABC-type multidrug transport system fused ATPase/permease subunit